MKRILFADNDPDFLSTRAEYLERADFRVYKATTLGDAERYLRNAWIHLAILDIRMTDDDDEKDVSGITLVNAEFANKITKIVLTSFNTPLVRDLVRMAQGTQPLTLDVIEKAEGPEALIAIVNDAFDKHIRINWKLVIDWRERDPFSLIRLIEDSIEGEQLLHRAEEFEDLFRRLFYESEYIRFGRLLWKEEGRVALIVFAHQDGMRPKAYVVVCGRNSMIAEEAQRFEQFAPNVPSDTGTRLSMRSETTHYAVNAYTFANIDLEKIKSLSEFYRTATPGQMKDVLTTLFQKTLTEWHQGKVTFVKKSSGSLYQRRLQLTDTDISHADFEERIRIVEKEAREHKLILRHTTKEVSFNFGERVFAYPSPLQLLSKTSDGGEALIINVPGLLTGKNILTNGTGHSWLTSFATAGQAPLFWNFVVLEAAIRFDWTDTDNFLRRQELEECLINGDFFKPDLRKLWPDVLKPAKAISALRGLAKKVSEQASVDYQLGLFFQTSRFFLDFNPASPLQLVELMRLVHIYLSMAMLTQRIITHRTDGIVSLAPSEAGIAIRDKNGRLILVGTREVHLTPREYAVFEYLFEKAGEVCTKAELVNRVDDKGLYPENYAHTLVKVIRAKIEDDPERPRYLVNVSSAGYRLVTNPK